MTDDRAQTGMNSSRSYTSLHQSGRLRRTPTTPRSGRGISDALSRLQHEHVNLHGRHVFVCSRSPPPRPLRPSPPEWSLARILHDCYWRPDGWQEAAGGFAGLVTVVRRDELLVAPRGRVSLIGAASPVASPGMLAGPVHAVAVLLVVAAVAKLRDPASAAAALGHAGFRAGGVVVRAVAVVEVVVGAAVLLVGGVLPAVALALLHLAFAAFIVRVRRAAGAMAGCGCFGGAEAPADRLHVVVNLAATGAVAASLAGPLPSLPAALADRLVLALPYAAAVAAGAWAIGLCLTSLPALLAAQRRLAS